LKTILLDVKIIIQKTQANIAKSFDILAISLFYIIIVSIPRKLFLDLYFAKFLASLQRNRSYNFDN